MNDVILPGKKGCAEAGAVRKKMRTNSNSREKRDGRSLAETRRSERRMAAFRIENGGAERRRIGHTNGREAFTSRWQREKTERSQIRFSDRHQQRRRQGKSD